MFKYICALLLIPQFVYALGCLATNQPSGPPHYVCIDGRMLSCLTEGAVWQARRGCFVSQQPCKFFQAEHYGYYPTQKNLIAAQMQCRLDYPYHLGEMQTH